MSLPPPKPNTRYLSFYQQPAIFFSLFLALVVPRGVLAHNPPVNKSSTGAGNSFLENVIADPIHECTPYYYPPVDSRLSSFPPIWEPAFILPGDTNAEAKWDSIAASVPNISVKGTPAGDIRDVRYSEKDTDCWWTYSKCVSPKHEGLPNDIADVPEPHTLAYGFDDGPNCSHNAFYDYLQSQNQQATMFYIGSNVMDWPLEAQRAVSDGHEICVHTWSHRYMTGFSSRDAFAELYYTIKLVAGVTPTCWRPPFGDVDDRIRAIANGLGLRTILWKYDTNDWRVGMPDPDAISIGQVDANYEALLAEAEKGTFSGSGAILLAHELNNFTMSEAVKYYQKLKSKFQNIVPLAVALNKTQPYVEDDFVLPSFADHISKGIPNASNDDPSRSSFAQATSLPSPVPDVDGFYSASNVDEIHSQDPELEISSMSSPLSLGFLSPASWRFTVFVGVLSVFLEEC
ncbi:chitin deacetylase [Coprinopsis cinerea AmutBmut pab1-1]|nr:chitin deacetylase [Coprinopsis cinerea AmutBmut pab1-1]